MRLVTRGDADGLMCAALLQAAGIVDEVMQAHPKDVQDGKIDVTDRDILTNLPYVEGCHLCFDHHESEEIRVGKDEISNRILDAKADSAAGVLYHHYGGAERFEGISSEMMDAVDKADAARFTMDDVLKPEGWVLLSFLMDARTGLGRFRDFRVSNYQLMMQLIDFCRDHSIDDILALPDVRERVEMYMTHREPMIEQIQRCSKVHGNLVVLDLRNEETIYAGNRFLIYALHPQCDVSMHVLWGLNRQNTVFAIGKSIFDRGNATDIGALALEHGGGGHEAAGTCQIDNEEAACIQGVLVDRLVATGGEKSRAA
jgi:nanoRNase/pAp phosphatase (c-di-AMP/oligoRNAs hydrolase)